MLEVLTLPSRIESTPLEHPSVPISFKTSGIVNNLPYAWSRCCLFLLMSISSFFSESITISYWIVLDLRILFQSVKSLGTSIYFNPDFIFGFIWKQIDACVVFICSIALSCQIAFSFRYFPSNSREIASSCRCCRWIDGSIEMMSLNFFSCDWNLMYGMGQGCNIGIIVLREF